MEYVIIENSAGTLNCDAYQWEESQSCDVAIRPVSTRNSGSKVDTSTHTLNPRTLRMTIKLTDNDKSILKDIFDACEKVDIVGQIDGEAGVWLYTAWFEKKPLIYKYGVSEGNMFEWRANLEFLVESFEYTSILYAVAYFYPSSAEGILSLLKVNITATGYEFEEISSTPYAFGSGFRAVSTDKENYYLLGKNKTDIYKLDSSGLSLVDDSTIYTSDNNAIIFIKYNGSYFLIGTVCNPNSASRIYKYDGTEVTLVATLVNRWIIDACWSGNLGKWLLVGEEVDGSARHPSYYTYDGSSFTDVTATVDYDVGENCRGPRGCGWSPNDKLFIITGFRNGGGWMLLTWDGSASATAVEESYVGIGEAIWMVGEIAIIMRLYNDERIFYTWDSTNGIQSLVTLDGGWHVELTHQQHGGYNLPKAIAILNNETIGLYGSLDASVHGLYKTSSGWSAFSNVYSKTDDGLYVLAICVSRVALS